MKKNLIILASVILVTISAIYYLKDNDQLKYHPTPYELSIKEVYISGAVNIPGYYRILENSELKDLIKMAGGTLVSADTSAINLNEKITKKEYQIAFYSKEGNLGNNEKINLNTATAKQLATLQGMGESRIAQFLNYRNRVGTIYAIEELMENVSGIGTVTFEKIKPYITV